MSVFESFSKGLGYLHTTPSLSKGQRNLLRNEMHGNGTYYWRDGRQYKGQFNHGFKEGHGEFSGTDLSKYTGEFTDDKLEGFGTLNMPDGQVYVGHFSDWKRFGLGSNNIRTYRYLLPIYT